MRATHLLTAGVLATALAGCDDDSPTGPPPDATFDDFLAGAVEVRADPSGRAPLTAQIVFETRRPVLASLAILPSPGGDPVEWEAGAAVSDHALPVLGLRADAWNGIEVSLSENGARVSDTFFVATPPLPDALPEIEVTASDPGAMEPGWTLGTYAEGAAGFFHGWPIMFDETGEIRWFLDFSDLDAFVNPMEPLDNGNLLAGSLSRIMEIDRFGHVVDEWDIGPEWVEHHDVIEKPDGNLLVSVNRIGLATVEDHMIELDRNSGEIVNVWDFREVMDTDRTALFDNANDWLHVNSVWYDETDGGIIVSARHQGVFKVSADNELIWILAPHRGWGPAGVDDEGPETSDFLLTAVDEAGAPLPDAVQDGAERTPDFDWPWAQHAAMRLPNGNILLFDNGVQRQFSPLPRYSRAVEYEIDEEAGTVRQVWAYGRHRGEEYYSFIVSDVDPLPVTGHRLVMPGAVDFLGGEPRAYVTEVTMDGSVVFEAVLRFGKALMGDVRGDILYRAERLPLYPD